MKRAVVGGLLGAASYLAYAWAKGTPPSMLPSLVETVNPHLWTAIAVGALGAYFL